MLIQCDENISFEQIDEIQKYKLKSDNFDIKQGNYA